MILFRKTAHLSNLIDDVTKVYPEKKRCEFCSRIGIVVLLEKFLMLKIVTNHQTEEELR